MSSIANKGLKLPFFVLLFILTYFDNFSSAKQNLKIEYKWSQIEFDFANEEERRTSIENGTFTEGMVQPISASVFYNPFNKSDKRVFVTTPRIFDGVPASLGIVTDKQRKGNPVIAPYPSWDWYTDPKMCKKQRIFSVFRVFIDRCNRLWVLDNGKIGSDPVCDPQILVFDLITDNLLHQYTIPFKQHLNISLYITPVVEVEGESTNCENTFVYNADSDNSSLLVYDFKNDKSWRIIDKTFRPDPNYRTFNIAGVTMDVMDGIFGLALTPPGPKRKLFYHALTSDKENWVYTDHLKNESLFTGAHETPKVFHTFRRRRKTQSAGEAMDKNGNLYFGLLGDVKLASWNIKYPYDRSYFIIIGDDKKTMQFPSGVEVTTNENGDEELWIFCAAYQRFATKTLSPNETNFYLLSSRVQDLPRY